MSITDCDEGYKCEGGAAAQVKCNNENTPAGSATCTNCLASTYPVGDEGAADAVCKPCEKGFKCADGTLEGHDACSGDGEYAPSPGTLACAAVQPGKYKKLIEGAETPSFETVSGAAVNSEVETCPIGYQCEGGDKRPVVCANAATPVGSAACLACTAGQFKNGTLCSECTRGNECPDGKDQVPCPGKDDTIHSGIELAAGDYVCWTSASNASISTPTCGSVGTSEVHLDAMTTGTSTVCGAADTTTAKWTVTTQVNVRAIHCSAPGSEVATPVTVSITIGGPKYTDEISTLKCYNVPPGKERVDASSIKPCEAGYECPGANIKTKCPNPLTKEGSAACTPCQSGQYPSNGLCEECEVGFKCPYGTAESREECPANEYAAKNFATLARVFRSSYACMQCESYTVRKREGAREKRDTCTRGSFLWHATRMW
jgi:hypothetical protein